MKSNFRQIVLMMCLAFICSFSFSISASAQEETSATITGQVTDSTGAAINNATIVVANTATGQARTIQSNEEGNYTVFPLIPGAYTISVEQSGFKKTVINTTLNARDRRPIDVVLEVGDASAVVTVTDEPPLLQDSSTGQALVSGNQVTELPLNNRNFIRLLETIPGVSSDLDDESNFGLTSRASVSINGLRRNAVNYLVDGVSNTDVGSNITLLSTPTVDSIQEFKVLSSNYTAEIGRSGGGSVIIVTRGGGNEYRGRLYEFVRNDYFNANSFFNNRIPRRADGSIVADVPKLRYNNFGGTFSGPLPFLRFGEGGPVFTSGKNKTFFFFSEEQRRIIRATTDAGATTPSALERQGNFSATLGLPIFRTAAGVFTTVATGNTPVTAVNTAGETIQVQQNQIFRPSDNSPYAGNIVPLSDIDPRSLGLLAAFPLPNGSSRNGFTFSPVNINNTRQEVVRIDHNFNANHKIFGRFTQDTSNTQESFGLFGAFTFPNISTTDTKVPGRVFAVSYTGIFSNSLVNEFTYNYSTNTIGSQLVGRGRRSDYQNAADIREFFPENPNNSLPGIFTRFTALNSTQGYSIEYGNSTFRDVLSFTRGNHLFKFGGEITKEFKNENLGGNSAAGSFGFAAAQSGGLVGTTAITGTGVTTGDSFASFLLGRANTYSEAQFDPRVRLRFGRTEFFAQDTWKIRPNLTLDLGVRYQYFRPVKDVNNLLVTFDPTLYRPVNPATDCATAACTALITARVDPLNGIARAGVNSRFGDTIIPKDKNNFSPRVGLAYQPNFESGIGRFLFGSAGKSVIRLGYGLYFDQPLVGIFENATFFTPPVNTAVGFTSTPTQVITFSNPGAPFGGSVIGATFPARNLGIGGAIAPDFRTPESQVYSIGIQREVFKNAVVDISYVGTKGDHLIRPRNINFITPERAIAAGASATTAGNINAFRPYIGFTNITQYETTAISRYNGFLSSFNYRLQQGFTVTLAYTFSKTLTDSTNDRDAIDIPQNSFDARAEYAEARTSRPHIFSASYVYELPFFRKSSNSLVRLLLGGYQLSGITNIESGAPVPRVVISATDQANGTRGIYPNAISDPRGGLAGTIDPISGLPFIFDPLAFEAAPIGQFGSLGRSFARLPGRNQTNLAVSKQFYFNKERTVYLQLRAESFNLFNTTQFTIVSAARPTSGTNILRDSLFARPNSTRLPREFQFGVKLYF
ncbi:MAG: carboxypeptidase regulatory-like domain-containing protein [Pyrinomonadaceae bacterium]